MISFDGLRAFCLQLPGAEEDFPFDEDTLTFKVFNKIFCLASLSASPLRINLKCDPQRAIALRDQYDAVLPGYHMNKKHWNTVLVEEVPEAQLKDWIRHSYDLVVKGLKRAEKAALAELEQAS